MLSFHKLAVGALLASGLANAGVILTFDYTASGVVPINQAYGNRVTATSDAVGSYGTFGTGFTPNIVAAYAGQSAGSALTRWTNDYGDLVNVFENDQDGDAFLTVTLTADPGYLVQLYSFDLAGWPAADYTLPNVFVNNGGGTHLYSQANVLVQGDFNGPRHTSFSFAPLAANTIQIYLDLTGLDGSSDNIGIDNIAFAQVAQVGDTTPGIPEPGTWALLGTGIAGLIAVRRRRVS